jgi:hypothetical protein
MTDRLTCGQGLSEHAELTTTLGQVADAMAENLEIHMQSLPLEDPKAEQEHAAYWRIAGRYRSAAADLLATGEEMAGYRDLPMGAHDESVLASPEVAAAFERLVEIEARLVAALGERIEQDRAVVEAARRHA